MRRFLPMTLACLLVAACSTLESVTPAAIFTPAARAPGARVTAGGELVAYLARIRDLGEKPLAAETLRQREAARAAPSDLETVKLAIALSLAPGTEDGEITSLMEPVSRRQSADDDLRAMASFLLVQAAERRRLKEGVAAAGSRLRDERRAHEAQKQRAEALQERATQLQERAAQLQQKIEALTELEKSLSDRPTQTR
jgi:hypothetical protein